jgi:hypothetical protein
MRNVLAIVGLCVLVPAARADVQQATINELSGEFDECSVYFAIAAEGAGRFSDAEVAGASKLAADYKQHAEDATALFVQLGLKAGATQEALSVKHQNVIKAQMEIMHGSYANVSLLQQRYATFCKHLMENPASRSQEIQSGDLCNSEYRCRE